MDLDLWAVGWREGLIAIIVLLLLYIVVIFVRMRRLQRQVSQAAALPVDAQSAVAAYAAVQEPAPAAVTVTPPAAVVPASAAVDEPASFPWNEPPPEIPGQALIDALRQEIEHLRNEVDELRGDVLAAREELRRPFVEPAEALDDASSPLYSGATQLAQQGHDATTIADHCGITRAEADLVVAMARSRREAR